MSPEEVGSEVAEAGRGVPGRGKQKSQGIRTGGTESHHGRAGLH